MIAEFVTFGDYTQEEFSLLPQSVYIPAPEPQTYTVEVPGRDGAIDLSDDMTGGILRFKNRVITMDMLCFADDEDRDSMENLCVRALHGKRMKIGFDTDPDHYFLGRLSVSWQSQDNIDNVSITADCDPYRYKNNITVCEYDVNGTLTITLQNEMRPTTPTITTDAEMQLVWGTSGENKLTLNAGTHRYTGLLLLEGDNEFTVNGTGHIKFEYQEGAL